MSAVRRSDGHYQVTGLPRFAGTHLGDGDLICRTAANTGYWTHWTVRCQRPAQYGCGAAIENAWPLIANWCERTGFTCQSCGTRLFTFPQNSFSLVHNPEAKSWSRCPSCHHRCELSVKIKSGLFTTSCSICRVVSHVRLQDWRAV